MANRYNFNKINKSKEKDLIDKITSESVGLKIAGSQNIDGFKLNFYVSTNPEPINIWWTDLYKDFIGNQTFKNTAHFAILLISNEELCYAISLGKSHFYLKEFSDNDFGINLGERIANPGTVKLKNSKLFGGLKSKTITSYADNSDLEYDSGESIQYIKAKTIDPTLWGTSTASFGNSAQLYLEETPSELPSVIKRIEDILREEPKLLLPRANVLKDEVKAMGLDNKLIDEILKQENATVQASEATVSGVDFVFLNNNQYQFTFGHIHSQTENELTVESLKQFLVEHNLNLKEYLNEIKVKVLGEGKPYSKPLKYFLDFVDEEKFLLLDGKWYEFNNNYIEYLKDEADRIIPEISDINLSESEYKAWELALPVEEKVRYKESYFNKCRKNEGYQLLDRDLVIIDGDYSLEITDLLKDKAMFFVKIGTPQKLSEAIDQSLISLKLLKDGSHKEYFQNFGKIDSLYLWLVLNRSQINKLSDIKSLRFLMKLVSWKNECKLADLQPIVRISYLIS